MNQSLTQSMTNYENKLFFTNLKFYLYQRLISIHPFYMTMIFYKFQVIIYREFHPFNIKRGGFCIFRKISIPIKIKNIHYLQECISFEIKIKGKLHISVFHYIAHIIHFKMILSQLSRFSFGK